MHARTAPTPHNAYTKPPNMGIKTHAFTHTHTETKHTKIKHGHTHTQMHVHALTYTTHTQPPKKQQQQQQHWHKHKHTQRCMQTHTPHRYTYTQHTLWLTRWAACWDWSSSRSPCQSLTCDVVLLNALGRRRSTAVSISAKDQSCV